MDTSNEAKIERLEQMVKSLAETISRILQVVNTGDYEYHIGYIRDELDKIAEFERSTRSEEPAQQVEPTSSGCPGDWHKAHLSRCSQWCYMCGKSV